MYHFNSKYASDSENMFHTIEQCYVRKRRAFRNQMRGIEDNNERVEYYSYINMDYNSDTDDYIEPDNDIVYYIDPDLECNYYFLDEIETDLHYDIYYDFDFTSSSQSQGQDSDSDSDYDYDYECKYTYGKTRKNRHLY